MLAHLASVLALLVLLAAAVVDVYARPSSGRHYVAAGRQLWHPAPRRVRRP